MDIEKRPQNGVFLIENWHLTDRLVYKSIFQTIIFLLPYVFVRLAIKPHLKGHTYFCQQGGAVFVTASIDHQSICEYVLGPKWRWHDTGKSKSYKRWDDVRSIDLVELLFALDNYR